MRRNIAPFASINPLHGFHVLNPDGDLPNFQEKFENFFIKQKLEVLYAFKFDKNRKEERLYICISGNCLICKDGKYLCLHYLTLENCGL